MRGRVLRELQHLLIGMVAVAIRADIGDDCHDGCNSDDAENEKNEHERSLSLGFRGNVDLTEAPLLVFDYVNSIIGIIAAQSHSSALNV